MPHYAHTSPHYPSSDDALLHWEPLFTTFGEVDPDDPTKACSGNNGQPCPHCESLAHNHGHLNKVAYLAAKFAGEMLPIAHPDRSTLIQWAYLSGLWHDLGKFTNEFQIYLTTASDPHSDEVAEKVDHTTAGAKHAVATSPFGHFIATAIAGHHAGLLDARHETHASLAKRLSKEHGKALNSTTLVF